MHVGSKSFALVLAFALGGDTTTVAQVAPTRAPQTIEVDHLAPDCLESGHYPELRLCLKEAMARAHIVFRPGREGRGGPWYQVPMESRSDPLGSCFVGLLPRPVMSIRDRRVTYQFLVTRTDLEKMESRTFEAEVVGRPSQCKGGRVAQSRDTTAPNVSLAEGEQGPSFPEGFAPPGDPAEAAEQPAAKAARRGGPDAGKLILGTVLLGGAAAGVAVAAGSLASLAGGRCISTRNCIVSVFSRGCECSQSTATGPCDWTGLVASAGESCGPGAPCALGLSCNNGRCEGPGGRCPF